MSLKYYIDKSIFYQKNGELFPEPSQALEELEKIYKESIDKYHRIKSQHFSDNYDTLDIELIRFNLGNFIENLEWKIDLKLLHQEFKENGCK